MEENNIIIEEKQLNPAKNIIPKKMLSILFKDYQNLLKEPNNEGINNNNGNNRKNTIDNINIKNDEDFSKAIITKLDEIKANSITRINQCMEKFKNNYEQYKKEITKFIEIKSNNIYKAIENNYKNDITLKYVSNNIFNKINNIIEIYDNIINNIENNFDLLNDNLLKENNLLNNKKPIEYFLNNKYENIFKCSILNQFNFNEIDHTHIIPNNYYTNYFNFLTKEKNNIIKTYIVKKEKKNEGIEFIKDNFSSIKNLHMHSMEKNDIDKIIDAILTYQKNNNDNKINIIKAINIKVFDFREKYDKEKFKDIELNKIKKIKLSYGNNMNYPCIYNLFLKVTDCLINLSLEKSNINNVGLKKLMIIIGKNSKILETLEYLSLAGNSISEIKQDIFKLDSKILIFKKLKIFNLHKNEIYRFDDNFDLFPALKMLDLSSNNIITKTMMENFIKDKKKLFLFNDNIFITNIDKNNKEYIKYLNKQLPNVDFEIKNLHLRFIFSYYEENEEKQKVQKHLEELRLSPIMKFSLIKLDLSFCGLTSNALITFLKNNVELLSLQKLNLKYNNIDNKVFVNLLSDDILMEELKSIDLSENDIICKEYDENMALVKFIQKYKNLQQIKLLNSHFIEHWNISIDVEKIKKLYLDLIKNIKNRNFIFIIDIKHSKEFIEKKFKNLFFFK